MVETTGKLLKLLLICGILASSLYIGTDLVAGTLWEGYSFTDQAVSELSAIGAPTRSLVVPFSLAYSVLMIAFGLGVWGSSRKRALRFIGGLLMGIGALGLGGLFFPIHLRGAEVTFTDIMHGIFAGVNVLLFLLAMGFGFIACGRRFRVYSIVTLLTLMVLGAVSGLVSGAQIIQQGVIAPPQWFGLIERIMVYGSVLWVAVLAIALLRVEKRYSVINY